DHEDDAEKPVDPGIGGRSARGLLKDAARLQSHVRRGDESDVKRDQADDSPDQTGEVSEDAVADDENERNRVDPGHVRNPAPCFFSSAILISAIISSTSASASVRSGRLKVKAKATLLCPSETCAPLYSSKGRALSRNSCPVSLMVARSAPAATCSSTTTARSRSIAGKRGSGCARLISAALSSGSRSISIATSLPSMFAPVTTLGCSSPR